MNQYVLLVTYGFKVICLYPVGLDIQSQLICVEFPF